MADSKSSRRTRKKRFRASFPTTRKSRTRRSGKREDLEQKLAKADATIEHLTFRAPISGIVQASAITTIGQVVSSGQEIMRIVPDDAGLEIEVYVAEQGYRLR